MQGMVDVVVTGIENTFLLKFGEMERKFKEMQEKFSVNPPRDNDPRDVSDSTTSGTTPGDPPINNQNEGFESRGVNISNSPDNLVKNVLAYLNVVEDDFHSAGDDEMSQQNCQLHQHTANDKENMEQDEEDHPPLETRVEEDEE
ncbi:unnamed protein product [Cochlearia groenlandica]